jgi:hypothetical protein
MKPSETATSWICGICGKPLEVLKVNFLYMDGSFEVDIPACRACELVLVPEELATEAFVEVERVLEDK